MHVHITENTDSYLLNEKFSGAVSGGYIAMTSFSHMSVLSSWFRLDFKDVV